METMLVVWDGRGKALWVSVFACMFSCLAWEAAWKRVTARRGRARGMIGPGRAAHHGRVGVLPEDALREVARLAPHTQGGSSESHLPSPLPGHPC